MFRCETTIANLSCAHELKGEGTRLVCVLCQTAWVSEDQEVFAKRKRRPEYEAYQNARARCRNPQHPSWAHYGGRGIEFKFTSFAEFFAHLGPRPSPDYSLDRINNNGNYELGNCRWATWDEQANNRRRNVIEREGSRQLAWQQKKLKNGRCRVCGGKRSKRSKVFCRTHLNQHLERQRVRRARKQRVK